LLNCHLRQSIAADSQYTDRQIDIQTRTKYLQYSIYYEMQDTATTGVLAAIAAPFFMALGFIIWDVIWKQSRGSAFALNLFKCNLASIGFVIAGAVFGFTKTNSSSSSSSSSTSTNNDDDDAAAAAALGVHDETSVTTTGTAADESTILISISYLILSGFIGIVIGDIAWLEALRQLGASRVLVIDTVKPFVAALLGWLVLGEALKSVAFSGIALTVVGILVVELERERGGVHVDGENDDEQVVGSVNDVVVVDSNNESEMVGEDDTVEEEEENRNVKEDDIHRTQVDGDLDVLGTNVETQHLREQQEEIEHVADLPLEPGHANRFLWNEKMRGYILAIGNVVLDTYGSLLTKQHGGKFSSWSINLIRFGSAGIIMIVISCVMRFYRQIVDQKTTCRHTVPSWYMLPTMDMISWLKICMGVLLVTFICPALSNYALFQIALALALTLSSITPLYALLMEWLIHGSKKKPTWRSLGGATLAVGGVVILGIFSS
jgi:Permeases of the drug/metabolite transporter (DMT) superfamily